MVPADAQTDLPVGLEATVGGHEAEGRRAQRVRGRQDDAAMVEAVGVRGTGRPAEGEVPLEEVGFEGLGCVVWRGGVADLGGFSYCLWQRPVSLGLGRSGQGTNVRIRRMVGDLDAAWGVVAIAMAVATTVAFAVAWPGRFGDGDREIALV